MLIWILVILAIIILAGVAIYNGLISLRNQVDEAWSDIDVQLKRRYDLIPNLLETVKGYKEYENATFQKITELRQQAMSAHSVEERGKAEAALSLGLGKLFAVAENYPDLKANTSFMNLQTNLSDTENQIQNARRYYNGTTRVYNTKIQKVPDNFVASLFDFTKREYFSLDSELEKEVPKIVF
jgi:LemA protein